MQGQIAKLLIEPSMLARSVPAAAGELCDLVPEFESPLAARPMRSAEGRRDGVRGVLALAAAATLRSIIPRDCPRVKC